MSRILILDDDLALAETLARSLSRRGHTTAEAHSAEEARALLERFSPDCAVVDLRLGGGENGLVCVRDLMAHNPAMRVVVLTGYASITTAVEAIKLGACHYLTKPASPQDILDAFTRTEGETDVPLTPRPSSLKNLEWERINEVLVETNYNISETARRLGLHRRTLARKLEKRVVR